MRKAGLQELIDKRAKDYRTEDSTIPIVSSTEAKDGLLGTTVLAVPPAAGGADVQRPAADRVSGLEQARGGLQPKPGRIWEVKCRLLPAGERAAERGEPWLEPGAVLAELALEGERLRFTLLTGGGPQDGWVRVPSLEAEPPMVEAGKQGSKAAKEAGQSEYLRQRCRSSAQKIWIMAHGSAGQVRPTVSLGVGLAKAGFQVRIFAAGCHRSLVESRGLLFTEQWVDIKKVLRNAAIISDFEQGTPGDCKSFFNTVLEQDGCLGGAVLRDSAKGMAGMLRQEVPDLVMATALCFPLPFFAWRRRNVPICRIDSCPLACEEMTWSWQETQAKLVRDTVFTNPLGGYNPVSYKKWLTDHRAILWNGDTVDDFQSEASAVERESASRLSRGFHFADPTQQMVSLNNLGGPATLCKVQAYLDAGTKPVYLGWGGMPLPVGFVMKLIAAFKASSLRAVISPAWRRGPLETMQDFVERRAPEGAAGVVEYAMRELLFVGPVFREWLLPRCACAVHHAGAGTTCAALRAGVPMLVTPVLEGLEHFAWADLACRLGAAVQLDAFDEDPLFQGWDALEDPALFQAVARVANDAEMAAKAQRWSKVLQAADGPEAMVDFVKQAIRLSSGDNLSVVDEQGYPRFGW